MYLMVLSGEVLYPPFYFCIYMDGVLNELVNSTFVCYMGKIFAGASRYADDLTLLTRKHSIY